MLAELGLHVVGDIVHTGVVAVGARHDRLGHGDNVPVVQAEPFLLGLRQHGIHGYLNDVVTPADDGRTDAP